MSDGKKAADEPGANLFLVAKIVCGRTRREYEITESPFSIGRSSKNHLTVYSRSLSRNHCRIEKREDGYYLSDVGSTNGTYVGKARVKRPRRLEDGDVIRVKTPKDDPRGGWSATFRLWYRALADEE